MVVGVHERSGMFPLIPAPPSRFLLPWVRDRPALRTQVEVDLLVGESDSLAGEDLPDLGGSARASVPFCRDELLLGLGEWRAWGSAVGVEAGHDPRSTPT